MTSDTRRPASDRKKPGRAAASPAELVLRFEVLLERPEGSEMVGFFRVPAAAMAAFAPRRRVPVVVTVNGHTWRSTISPYGSDFFVPVRAENRFAIGATLGEKVHVTMQRDTAVRRVDVPKDLAQALRKAGVRAGFDALSFTFQKEHVQSIDSAKRPETRLRRIEQAVAKSKEKQAGKRA